MANNETTTSFKADISELKRAMQEARRQVAIANSEFEASASTMEDWSRSSDGITAKLRQLDTTLNSQRTILANYERQLERTRQEYPEGGRAVDELIVQINRQRASINRTEREIEQYRQSLEEVSNAEREASRSGRSVAEVLDDVGDSAGDAGDGFTTFKGAIASFAGNMLTGFVNAIGEGISAIVNLADETREYRTELGKLETAFSTAGFSGDNATDTYKELFSVIGETDQAVEASQQIALLASAEEDLAKWADLAGGVVGRFGDALQPEAFYESANETLRLNEATGTYVQMLEGVGYSVDEFNAGLQACTTEEEKQAYMLQVTDSILGEASKTYKEVNADIIDAQKAQADLTDATANLGAVAEPIMTTFKSMGATFLNELLPSVTELGAGFTDLMNGVDGAGEKVGSAVSNLLTTFVNKAIELAPTIIQIGLTLVSNLIQGILSALPNLVTTAVTIVITLFNTLGTELPNIAMKITEVIPLIIDALLSAYPQLLEASFNFFMAIIEAIPLIISSLTSALPQIIETIIETFISMYPALVEAYITLLMALIDAIPLIMSAIGTALPQIIQTIYDFLPQILGALWEGVFAIVKAIPSMLLSIGKALLNIVVIVGKMYIELWVNYIKFIAKIATFLWDWFKDIIPKIWSWLVKVVTKVAEWRLQMIEKVKALAIEFINTLITHVSQLPSKIWTWLVNVVTKVVQWRANLIAKAREVAISLVEALINKVKELPNKIKSIGTDIVKGLWNGINDMTSWIKDKIQGFGDSVLGGLKDFFGINSPSKLMADEIGKFLPQGIAVGIDKNAKSVMQSMRDVTMGAVSGARAGLVTGGAVSTGGAVGAGGVVNNFYQTNNSPKALSRLEIYRQSKNLLGLAGGM